MVAVDSRARPAVQPRAHRYVASQCPSSGRESRPPVDDTWCRIVEYTDCYTLQFGGTDETLLPAHLEALRGTIPPQRRRWNPATNTWWIDPAVERMLGSLSRWAARRFAAERVFRAQEPRAETAAWNGLGCGDEAVEGWLRPSNVKSAQPAGADRQRPAAWTHSQSPASAAEATSAQGVAAPNATKEAPGSEASQHSGAVPAARGDPFASAYEALYLRSGAPWPVIKAAYRALATIHHPDLGGSDDAMRDLNAAYALLRRALGTDE